jgi:hypothetical protein
MSACACAEQNHVNITLVSGFWDLGRANIKTVKDHDFRRPFNWYLDAMRKFLEYEFPKILFLERQHFDVLRPSVSPTIAVREWGLTCQWLLLNGFLV